jgi:flagella basal body P-ring formation protein FlgA
MIDLCFGSRSVHLIAGAVLCLAGALSAHAGQVLLPVPRVTIYPGQVIEQGMLVERAFRSGSAEQAVATPSSDGLIGKVARQTLLPGRPVSQAALRQPHAITQGQSALIIFQSGALTITGNAIALQSGATGDVVSVRNVDSGRIIKGTIGSDGAVHVGGP